MAAYSTYSDQELLELMAQDREAAFSELYERYWKKTLAVAIHKVTDISEAESILQDIFYSLWNRRKDLQVSTSFSNYLMASVKYRVIKVLNKRRMHRINEKQSLESLDIMDDSTQQYL